jgi:protease IV
MSKSTKWFLIFLAILALVGISFTLLLSPFLSFSTRPTETVVTGSGDRIGLVELKGVISSSEEFNRQVKKFGEDRSIRALLIRIDSPGGGVVASQEMYEQLRSVRDRGKPVVVSMGSLAASGGYYVACGASRLVANRGTLTGSIGVISEFLQVHEALDKLGIDVRIVKSGRLKDAGVPTRPMTEDDQKYFQSLMDEVHRQFIGVVREERKLSQEKVVALADGRVFTGEQAVKEKLVDTLGTFEESVAIAAAMAGIKGEPSLVRERKRVTVWNSLFGDVGETMKDLKQEILDRPVLSYRFTGPQGVSGGE